MTVDLLSQRLKAAKRELTNLKTAHKRGLGTLKVYRTEHYFADDGITPPNSYRGKLRIKFSQDFTPYPFFYVYPTASGDDPWYYPWYYTTESIKIIGMHFEDGGYTAVVDGDIWYSRTSLYQKVVIFSTAPIESVTGSWTLQ
jgi:hypothetical protein